MIIGIDADLAHTCLDRQPLIIVPTEVDREGRTRIVNLYGLSRR